MDSDHSSSSVLGERAPAQIREHPLRDPLTGLPSRELLIDRMGQSIQRCQRSGELVAILLADLDSFKSINQTYGHGVGDELLKAVAYRLRGLLRPGDTLTRLAGDQFAVLCEDLQEASCVTPIAARMDAALNESFVVSDIEVEVSANVGIVFAGHGADIPAHVLEDAGVALSHLKRDADVCHEVFDVREQQAGDQEPGITQWPPDAEPARRFKDRVSAGA